jgi:hypothetical protein
MWPPEQCLRSSCFSARRTIFFLLFPLLTLIANGLLRLGALPVVTTTTAVAAVDDDDDDSVRYVQPLARPPTGRYAACSVAFYR